MPASRRNRYSKSLQGLNAVGIISPALAYTAQTTFAGFVGTSVTPALNGTVAVINDTTKAVVTTPLTAGTKFFLAQLVDGSVKKTPVMTFGAPDTIINKKVYVAPVKQVTTIGWNGTSGSLNLTAPVAPATKTAVLSARDTSPSNQPFPVQEGRAFIKNPTATLFDMTAAIVSEFLNAVDYQGNSDINFVNAEVRTNGTNTAIATVTATFTEGSAIVSYSGAHTLAVGEIIEYTAANTSYKVVEVLSTTLARLDRPYAGTSVTTAGGGTGKKTVITATGIILTAFVEDTTFVISLGQDLANATVTQTTPWKQGSGAAWQVAAMEEETQVMGGFTTGNYPFVQDYGKPTSFVINPETSALQYVTWFLKYRTVTDSMAYVNEPAAFFAYALLACPDAGGPLTTLNTVLGT